MKNLPFLVKITTTAVFAALVLVFLSAASHKPLWNDEIRSQVFSIEGQTYGGILAGQIENEGNVSPLFYLIQKIWGNAWHYQTPKSWNEGQGDYFDLFSQVFLRVLPVVCMVGSVAAIFYFFSSRFSVWLGFYSLLVSLSSFMVWAYGPEARHYALWFFLTTAQLLYFLDAFDPNRKGNDNGGVLILLHFLLAMTVVYGIIQISAVSLMLWWCKGRNWRKLIGLWLGPAAVIVFYLLHSPHYQFYFLEGFVGLIGASFPKDRFFICFIFALWWGLSWVKQRGWINLNGMKGIEEPALRWTGILGVLMILFLAGFLAILLLFKLKASPMGVGYQISNRYFICLAPLGIIATTLCSYYLVQNQKGLGRALILVVLGALLLWRISRTTALMGSLHLFS